MYQTDLDTGGIVATLQSAGVASAGVSVVQSAAMGGYGVVIVVNVVRALSVGTMVLSAVRGRRYPKRIVYKKSV